MIKSGFFKNPSFAIVLVLSLTLSFPARPGYAEDKPTPKMPIAELFGDSAKVETVADQLEYDRNTKKVIAKGNVVITYGEDKITADYAEVEQESRKAYAKGHVIIFRQDAARAKGEEVYYDFESKTGSFPNGSAITGPWQCEGESIDQVREGVMKVRNGSVTTCKGEKPPYSIHAKDVTFYDDDKIVAKNVTIRSMGVPIFWWPYMIIPLKNRNFPLSVTAGYSSDHGAEIEISKGISINKNLSGRVHADWRSKRGFGTGGDLDYNYGKWAKGQIRGYWTQDDRAPVARENGGYGEREDRDRGRLSWRHRTDIDDYSFALMRYERMDDEFFLQDFFEKEFRAAVQPQSFFTVQKNSPRYGVMVHGTKRMNKFERTVERLPEVRLDWKNQPFFSPHVYYENQTSYANLTKVFGRNSFDQDVQRLDHVSRWVAPVQYKGIKFTPTAFVRNTYYSRERDSENDHYRAVGGFHLDTRTQLYRQYDTSFEKAGIEVNQLRHIVEPYFQFLTQSSTVSNEKLDYFDSIDDIDDENSLTFGVENRIQTKRVVKGKMKRVDLVSLNTFLRYQIHPDVGSPASRFTAVGADVILRPYDWLQYEAKFEYDVRRDTFRQFTQDLIARTKRFLFLFGHRYIDNEEYDIRNSSNQFIFDARWVLNEKWRLGGYIRFDTSEDLIDEWQLSALRNFGCVMFEFGLNVRDSDIDSNGKELFFKLFLTEFPDYSLRGGGSRATLAPPRIGETVSGANERRGGLVYEDANLGMLGNY